MASVEKPRVRFDPTSTIKLSGLMHGIVHTQLIYVAARLRLADLLKDGPRSVDELAAKTDTIPSRLYRALRALASLGLFVETEPRHFANTPLSEPLQMDHPASLHGFAVMLGAPWHATGWANILHCVQKNESAFTSTFGKDVFEHLRQNPRDGEEFDRAMTVTSKRLVAPICQAYAFPEKGVVVDIAGGNGFLLAGILKKRPQLRGILFDRPAVAAGGRALLESENLTQRCAVVSGDFFAGVPDNGDLYILKYIIHDWDDGDAVRILTNVRKAMRPESRLLVIDVVMPPGAAPFGKTWADIEMMVMLPNGRERNEQEFRELYAAADLHLDRIVSTRSELSIMELLPAGSGTVK